MNFTGTFPVTTNDSPVRLQFLSPLYAEEIKGQRGKAVCFLHVFLEIELFFFANEVISGNLTSQQIKRSSLSGRSGTPTLEILLIPKNLQGNIRLYCSLMLSR